MKWSLSLVFSLISILYSMAQEVRMTEKATANQIFGLQVTSDKLLPMSDLNMDNGYVLYQSKINIESEDAVLEVENIRDYATVYINGVFQGVLNDNQKKITLLSKPGNYTMQLYAENIGRITYGPEILDNSKGVFGSICVDGKDVDNWEITELKVKGCSVNKLIYSEKNIKIPCFHKGYFSIESPEEIYLDITGWGMGEAWINGQYAGSYWEAEKQRTIQIPASILKKGINDVVVFELKNNEQKVARLSNVPVFK